MSTITEIIIKKVEDSYNQILRLYQNVPVTALVKSTLPNGWSVKDTVAHLAAWNWRCAALLDAAHHTDGPLTAWPDVDGLNREFYQERHEWSWADVELDFRRAHAALLEAIRRLPPGRLNEAIVQEAIAEETWEHYAEHLPDLERWHKQLFGERAPVT